MSVLPACHCRLLRLVDLLHPCSLHLRSPSLVARSSSPHPRLRVPPHFLFSFLRHNAADPAIPSLRCTASNPFVLVPSHGRRSPHIRRGLSSVNLDGFRTPPVCSTRSCSLLLTSLLYRFWHTLLLTLRPPCSPFAPSRSVFPFIHSRFPCYLFHDCVLPAPARAFAYF